jgi:hypothetical protein
MLVWKAMPSIVPMMSAMRRELSLMPFIVSTTWPTTAPPWIATVDALCASWLAWRALSAFCRTVDPSCSIDAAVCSSALACSSVRWLRSWLPWAICALAVATLSALLRTLDTTRFRPVCMSAMAASSGLNSSRAPSWTTEGQVAVAHPFGNLLCLRHAAAQHGGDVPAEQHQQHDDTRHQALQHVHRGLGVVLHGRDVGAEAFVLVALTVSASSTSSSVAGRNGLVHQVGKGLGLLAVLDEPDVGLAFAPEAGHQGRQPGKALATGGRDRSFS